MTTHRPNSRPAAASGLVAVLAAVGVVLALAASSVVTTWLAVELGGLLLFGLGVAGHRSGYRLSGLFTSAVGGVVCVAALGGLGVQTGSLSRLLGVLPGFLGLTVLTCGLLPVRGEGSRGLVKIGTGGVFLCVVLAGLFRTADLLLLLGTTVGTVLAWDAGEHAIGVGKQLGRQATTWRLEATHLGGTLLVGAAGSACVFLLRGSTSGGLSFGSFALVFVAVLLLTVALRW